MTTHILGDNVPRKSNFDPDLARKVTKYYEEHPEELNDEPTPQTLASGSVGRYILMPKAKTYAQGIFELRTALVAEPSAHPMFELSDGGKIFRPLSFKETIKARVENFETTHNPDGSERTLDERLFLITESWNDSCTAIAYKAGTAKFKVVPISEHLITLNPDFSESFVQIEYNSLNGLELDSKGGIYNSAFMTKELVQKHEGWLAVVEGDGALLTAYTNIIFKKWDLKYSHTEAMRFAVQEYTPTDELRSLSVNDIYLSSSALGTTDLKNYNHFLRRKP